MSGVWLVCLGAAVGAPARYLLDRRVSRGRTTSFPAGTFTVNLLGSLLLGLLLGVHDGGAASPVGADLVLLLGTGFCGAFTTYSAFAVEVVALGPRRSHPRRPRLRRPLARCGPRLRRPRLPRRPGMLLTVVTTGRAK